MKREDLEKLFFLAGRPFGPVYGLLMRLRATLYRKGMLASVRLPAPVVSVGNLTLGGTGKTPMVRHVAGLLQRAGCRPAVVSRGYGGMARQPVNVVSDGEKLLLAADQAGDEPRLLAELLPGVPVLTGTRRALPAQYAVERFRAGCVVLDDGFQHLALQRDIDVVLVDGQRPFLRERVFPAGRLRESHGAIRRAHAVVITNSGPEDSSVRSLTKWCNERLPEIPVFTACYRPEGVVNASGGALLPLDALKGKPLFAFCGLAEPEGFRRTLRELGVSLCGFVAFADHQRYVMKDVRRLSEAARQAGADALVTTEKDLVKIRSMETGLPLVALRVAFSIDGELEKVLFRLFAEKGFRF